MAHFCAASIPRIDVLLGILSREVFIVIWLPQMWGAHLAGVAISHVKPRGITCIPVGKPLCEVQIWGGLDVPWGWGCIISTACRRVHSRKCWCPPCCNSNERGCTARSKCGWVRILVPVHVLVRHGFQKCCLQTGSGQTGAVGEDPLRPMPRLALLWLNYTAASCLMIWCWFWWSCSC